MITLSRANTTNLAHPDTKQTSGVSPHLLIAGQACQPGGILGSIIANAKRLHDTFQCCFHALIGGVAVGEPQAI